MTFFKVNDPKNRELIKEVIAKRSIIREADRKRKMGEAFEFEQLSRFFKPITKQTEKMEEKIEKGFKGLPGEIAKVLPKPIETMGPPPAYEAPFAGEAEIPEGEKPRKKTLPREVKEIDGGYEIGDEVFKIDEENKTIQTEDETIESEKIYNILTDNKYNISWDQLDTEEKYQFGKLIVDSNILYGDNKDIASITPKNIGGLNRWKRLYKPIWYNRFLFMNQDRLETNFEEEHMRKSYNQSKIRNTETKKLIATYVPDLKGKTFKSGQGLSKAEKNYVTLPNDPTELVDRLTLLAGSKDAGNTGVYNEMVSICDELLKKKIIGKEQYKQFLSTIN